MRKLLITLAMAGALSFPSFVFADEAAEEMTEEAMAEEEAMEEEAPVAWYDTGISVYGSLRIGVSSSDSNINVVDGGSRWGIKGTHDAGEGLTAVYRFETGVDDAAELSGRLSYVGLSGAFGSVTVGRINSAGYAAVGPILDGSWYYGGAGVGGSRLGKAVSYAFSNDLMTVQVDASYDTPDAVATENVGGVNVATLNAVRNTNNLQQVEFGLTVNVGDIGKVGLAYVDDKYSLAEGNTLTAADGTTAIADPSSWQTETTVAAAQVSVSGLTVYVGSARDKYTNTSRAGGTDAQNAVVPDAKTTFFGFGGSLGDTGVGYRVQWRDLKASDSKPWLISLTKGLGANTSLVLEHANNDKDPNATQVGLVVNF